MDMVWLLALLFNTNFERAQKLSVLIREVEFGVVALLRRQLLPVDKVCFPPLVKANRDFQNQEQVVSRGADPAQDFSDPVRLRQRFVDGGSQFFDQEFEIVVKFQNSPGLLRRLSQDLNCRTRLKALSR